MNNIKAKIIADSESTYGTRITTFELEYPRFIHGEFMTHRLFSRNAASSRAIPVERMIELVKENTAMPIHWGKNQPGMSAKEECNEMLDSHSESPGYTREDWWKEARDMAIIHAREYANKGYHKQIVNRLTEPFSMIKVVCTATDYNNFWWLRDHKDAQPEIQELARKMKEAYDAHLPVRLEQGEWHTPYYMDGWWNKDCPTSLEDALAISSSCCAQVSYRRLDDSIDKAREIFARLIESKPAHASPMEHQATPIDVDAYSDGFCYDELPKGITSLSREDDAKGNQNFWSGNFRNWIQHRQLIPENAKYG